MAGYTRQSLAQILNGEIVSAPPLNAEFNQILAAFNNSTGHKHDGTAAEGPPIDRIADVDQNNLIFVDSSANQINFYVESSAASVGQISIQDGAIVPFTDDDVDLGSSSFEFKDLYIDGTANIDSLVADTADINAGTIDNTVIGATTPAAATFTNLTVSTGGSIDFAGTAITSITSAGQALLDDADASAQRTTLGLGTIATQDANNVAITGGAISNITNISDIGNALPYTFSTTTTDSDPGSGVLRLNSATQNTATEIYIDDEEANAADVSAFIQLLSGGNNPSSVLGTITLRKEFNPDSFLQFKVTGVTNAAGYTKLSIINTSSSTANPFSNSDNVFLDIGLAGDKGDPGDVTGPASSTDNAIVRWDGTGGNLVQDSSVVIDDSDNITGVTSITASTGNFTTVDIDGGDITGITDLAVADGGTGASDAATARSNLGAGDVNGPASSTDNTLVRWDGTTGKTIQNSSWALSDAEALTAGGTLDMSGNAISGAEGVKDIGGAMQTVGATASAHTLDLTTYAGATLEPTADIALAASNYPAGVSTFIWYITGGGDHALDFSHFANAADLPTLQAGTAGDVLIGHSPDGGTTRLIHHIGTF